MPRLIFDRRLLTTRRDRAARCGAPRPVDYLLARVAADLRERLSLIRRTFPVAVNLGSHHGLLSSAIRDVPGIDLIICTDLAQAALALCSAPKAVADEEALPFAPGSLDLVVSGLSLQWVNDLPGTLIQIRQALKPDGLALLSLLGGQTLHELRSAWIAAESELLAGAAPRVAPFADVRDLGGLLQRAGFALPVADSDVVTVLYDTPLSLMRDLQAMGATNVLVDRSRRPVTRALLIRASELYAERFARADGRIPATFEILTMTAWAPHPSQPQPLRPGSATRRLADALGTVEHRSEAAADEPEPKS
jgi:SAM-dependent methyltransferase